MVLDKDLCPVPLRDDEHKMHIRTCLKLDDNILVSQTLIDKADLFAWIITDTPGVNPNIITHCLYVTDYVLLLVFFKFGFCIRIVLLREFSYFL